MSPKLYYDISGVLHEEPTSFIHNYINYLLILLYMTNNNTEKLMFLPYKSGSITPVTLVVKSARLIKVLVALQNCTCQVSGQMKLTFLGHTVT